ncbi:MAG: radical SAM protein [bacterium]
MKLWKLARAVIGSRYLGAPFFFRFYVTRRCNMRCRMCNVWKYADPRGEMNLEQIGRVIDEIRKTGVRYVVITGGEPFLRGDLPRIVSMLDRAGFLIRVQTNAGPHVTEELLDSVIGASCGRLDLTVSLDSLDPSLQDSICNSKGALESTMRVLRMAVRKLPRSMINANIVVNKLNVDEISEIVRTLDAMRVWSNPSPINMPSPGGSDMLLQRFDDKMAFSPDDAGLIGATFDELIRMKEGGYRIGHSTKFLRESARFLTTGEKRWPECEAGILYFSVFPSDIVHSNAMLMERFKTFFKLFARDYYAHGKSKRRIEGNRGGNG